MREYPVSVNMTITPCAALAACQVGQWSLQSCPLSFAIYACFSLSMLDGLEARLACAGMVQQIRCRSVKESGGCRGTRFYSYEVGRTF